MRNFHINEDPPGIFLMYSDLYEEQSLMLFKAVVLSDYVTDVVFE